MLRGGNYVVVVVVVARYILIRHPNTQQNISPELYQSRSEQWGFKVLGAYVGTKEYIKNSLDSKMEVIKNLADTLLKYPNSQARFYILKHCFNQKINYWLRSQFPEDCKDFLDDFKKTQMKLIASYHGIYDQETFNNQLELFTDLYKRASFPIANGGLALRSIDSVYLTAFVCSMAASFTHLANHFSEWIQTIIVDNVHKITSTNENISPYTNDQIMYCVQKVQSIVPNRYFENLTTRSYL